MGQTQTPHIFGNARIPKAPGQETSPLASYILKFFENLILGAPLTMGGRMFIPFKLSVIASDCILFHALLLLCCASAGFLLIAVTFFQGPSPSFDSDGSQRLHCSL